MIEPISVNAVVENGGYTFSSNGNINFTVKTNYDELVNVIKTLQMLNSDIDIRSKLIDEKPKKLGDFRFKQVVILDDGQAKLKFTGLSDYVNVTNLNSLPLSTDDTKLFKLHLSAEIENEEDEND